MLASSAAFAQSEASESTEGGAAAGPAAGEWRSYANERHVLARLQGGVGLRLFDPYSAGVLAPGWIHAQGGYLFVNVGKLRMGPTLGAQLGIDPGHSGLQGAVQPGWTLQYRSSPRWAILARLDIPFVITHTWNPANDACIYLPGMRPAAGQPDPRVPVVQDPCQPSNMLPARVPYGISPAIAIGVEAGGTFAYYLTGGFALTAEVNAGLYFGDSSVSLPVVGVGLGALFDYELLP